MPQPVPPHVFALTEAVGEDGQRLRYARFVRQRKSSELAFVEYHEEPLGGEVFARHGSGGLREAAGLAGALDRLLARVTGPVSEASLVLPDGVVRHVFSEIGELPSDPAAGEDILRWKLKRLIPQRVDEMRLGVREVPSLANQEEPDRLLVAFAPEALLGQLEDLFAARGIHLGLIGGEALLTVAALTPAVADLALAALVVVEEESYTVTVLRHGEPFLVRPKVHPPGDDADRAGAAGLELRLTRSYLGEQLPTVPLERVLVVAPEAAEPAWLLAAREALGASAVVVRREHLGLGREGPPIPWRELLSLVGAAATEVR